MSEGVIARGDKRAVTGAVGEEIVSKHLTAKKKEKLVVTAASLGTMFEWFDFYLYGLLATYISSQFFSGVNETTAFILALAAFAAGFAVRPFGSLVFGRFGDIIGRKYTFLVTMGLMGFSTFAVGLLPSYASIGVAAPIILVALRLLQGLAVGGEYGGAATYVAEHAPHNRRGFFTSFIQTTATLGLILALLLVIGLRALIGEEAFADWGWRVPFLLSIVLLAISLWIRIQLEESPVFQRMKEEGATSKAPIKEAFGQWNNIKFGLIALFGAVAGQAVIGYTAQFYTMFYLEKILKVDPATANTMILIGLILGTPFFVIFAWLSDRIGRKPIIVTACLVAAVIYFPAFKALTYAANPALAAAVERAPVTVVANGGECSLQFDPVGKNTFDSSSCDIAKAYLAKGGINYSNESAPAGKVAEVHIGDKVIVAPDPVTLPAEEKQVAIAAFAAEVKAGLDDAGYPLEADPEQINKPLVVMILFGLMLVATAPYAPLAAMLVELFPARIRYTAMSLPYHIGNGWFGGFLPSAAFAMVAATGDIFFGLWYPVVIAGMTCVVGALFLPETFRRNIHA
ncbi:MFS transporter [Microbulbifer hydrolyticus]|uniref:MFS family arabinose efflux permease n=1 Tax=Microbulbifer hydrolyticus TaxID=48074 RepID=A0A6P1TA74_9GAMM|nr:MFS transporter [Microbulbifer hydrolyticus]MBB5211993.1 putative MFS family arabinose efflux permease [Microbulbifer hydrolyticus]QHQ39674.1 MFS transporter [Microbulbifer hydrolyticus]